MNIDICLCTFRRPSVVETLASVARADLSMGRVRLIVIDNDDTPSAQRAVREVAKGLPMPLLYRHVPGRNISVARNGALAVATGDWLAFVDDDELVEPDWLTTLIRRQQETGADAVFGQSRACYGSAAPEWMVAGDFHSQLVRARRGVVETGHTCNALLRWRGTAWQQERFDLARGRSGGEDTEFFFRLRRLGAVYAVAEASVVREAVPEQRLSLRWLLRRRYRMGQSYAASATLLSKRLRLLASAAGKALYCFLRAGGSVPSKRRAAFWLLRAAMHAGVCAGCFNLRQAQLYGD